MEKKKLVLCLVLGTVVLTLCYMGRQSRGISESKNLFCTLISDSSIEDMPILGEFKWKKGGIFDRSFLYIQGKVDVDRFGDWIPDDEIAFDWKFAQKAKKQGKPSIETIKLYLSTSKFQRVLTVDTETGTFELSVDYRY